MIDPMQLMRISQHPIDINDNLIIYDDLEHGALRIYEQIGGPVTIQQLDSQFTTINNVVLLAEVVVNSIWRETELFVWKVSCEYGHENLIESLLNHVLRFASYYSQQYESIAISDREYEKIVSYAPDTLKNFQKINRTYVYYLDGHGME